MPIPCPHCHQAINIGSQFCAACGASLLLEATPDSSEPACAVHPHLRSLAPCSRCGAFSCAQCLHLNPLGEAVCTSCRAREPDALLPWDRREELGLLKAFWKTCLDVMLRPTTTFAAARAEGSVGSSLLFVVLCSFIGVFTTALLYAVLFAVIPLPQTSDTSEVDPTTKRAIMVGMVAVWIVLAPVAGMMTTFISAGIDHLILRLAGAQRGFDVTLRGNALSQAPFLLGIIPLCSAYVAPFWTLTARAFAYQGLHRTTWGPAIAGALAAPLLTCLLCGGGYFLLIMAAMSDAFPK